MGYILFNFFKLEFLFNFIIFYEFILHNNGAF